VVARHPGLVKLFGKAIARKLIAISSLGAKTAESFGLKTAVYDVGFSFSDDTRADAAEYSAVVVCHHVVSFYAKSPGGAWLRAARFELAGKAIACEEVTIRSSTGIK
jgi:hypothetical protein